MTYSLKKFWINLHLDEKTLIASLAAICAVGVVGYIIFSALAGLGII